VNKNGVATHSNGSAVGVARNDIVAGGRRVEVAQRYRPKTNLFSMLAVLWCFPTAGALVIVVLNGPRWMEAGSLLKGLHAIGFEQWIAIGLIAAHAVFGWLAWKFHRDEPIRERVVRVPNPDHDTGTPY
jgi:hypothetical protein